jgi:hypothetical protein
MTNCSSADSLTDILFCLVRCLYQNCPADAAIRHPGAGWRGNESVIALAVALERIGTVLAMTFSMEAVRMERSKVLPRDRRVVLRDALRKQIQRTVISVEGVAHRLRLVDVSPGTDKRRRSVLITVSTDSTTDCAHVTISRDRLEYPDFVVSLLAHAMRGVLMGELAPDGVEAL